MIAILTNKWLGDAVGAIVAIGLVLWAMSAI